MSNQCVGDADPPHERYLKSLAPGSRSSMLSALTIAAPLLGYPNIETVDWDSVHPSVVLMLRERLQHCGHARSTNCRILAGVNGALKEAARSRLATSRNLLDAGAAHRMRCIRKPAGRRLTHPELDALHAQCDSTAWGLQSAAILALLYAGGLRCYEAARATVADYDLMHRAFRFTHKPCAERFVPLNAAAAEDLEYWIYNPDWPITGNIFLHIRPRCGKPSTRPLQAVGIHDTLDRLADLAGVTRFNPNDLRRTSIAAVLAGDVGTHAAGHTPDNRLGDRTSTCGATRRNAHMAAMTRPITDTTADTTCGPTPKKPRRVHPAPSRHDQPISALCRPKANSIPTSAHKLARTA